MARPWTRWGEEIRRRLGDLAPREQRALAILAVAVVAFAVGLTIYLVQAGLSEREARNRDNEQVLRLVKERGVGYRDRMAAQQELNHRLATDLPPLPSILGEVLGELGQTRQDFQELAPEPVGPAGQKKKPWLRLSVKFPLRKVSPVLVYEMLLKLRDRYPDLPLAVTRLDMRLDRSEENLYNVEMIVSAYRLAELPDSADDGPADAPKPPAARTGTVPPPPPPMKQLP